MSEELKCNFNSGSRGSNRRQGQLAALRITMKAIRAITSSFRDCLRGDNSRMDSLVDNVNFILDKQSCLNAGLGEGNDASEPMEISGSSPSVSVGTELESLKAGLLSIQLQLNAYRGLADDHGSLNLLLQNLDALIGKHSQVLPPSIRVNNIVQSPTSSASAKVEIIDLEPDLPDSTFETFDIKPRSDGATAVADEIKIMNHNLNPVSASTGDPSSVGSASTKNGATQGFASKHIEEVEFPPCSSFLAPSTVQNRKRKTDSNVNMDSRPNMASKTAKVVTKPGRSSSSTRSSLQNSREDHHIGIEIEVTAENPNFIHNNKVNLDRVKIEADYDPPGRNQKFIKLENSDDVAFADNDVKMSDKSSIEKDKKSAKRSPDPDVNNGLGETVQVQDLALNLTNEATLIQQNGSSIFEQNKIWTAKKKKGGKTQCPETPIPSEVRLPTRADLTAAVARRNAAPPVDDSECDSDFEPPKKPCRRLTSPDDDEDEGEPGPLTTALRAAARNAEVLMNLRTRLGLLNLVYTRLESCIDEFKNDPQGLQLSSPLEVLDAFARQLHITLRNSATRAIAKGDVIYLGDRGITGDMFREFNETAQHLVTAPPKVLSGRGQQKDKERSKKAIKSDVYCVPCQRWCSKNTWYRHVQDRHTMHQLSYRCPVPNCNTGLREEAAMRRHLIALHPKLYKDNAATKNVTFKTVETVVRGKPEVKPKRTRKRKRTSKSESSSTPTEEEEDEDEGPDDGQG